MKIIIGLDIASIKTLCYIFRVDTNKKIKLNKIIEKNKINKI